MRHIWTARRCSGGASRFPLTRAVSRRSAEEVYDLVAGFVYSQTLLACVEFDLLRMAQSEPIDPDITMGVMPWAVSGRR